MYATAHDYTMLQAGKPYLVYDEVGGTRMYTADKWLASFIAAQTQTARLFEVAWLPSGITIVQPLQAEPVLPALPEPLKYGMFEATQEAHETPADPAAHDTLAQERARLADAMIGRGSHCGACDKWVKAYKRNINRTMADGLAWLVGAAGDERKFVNVPVEAPRWLVRSNQLATLKYWDLVESKPPEGKKLRRSGMWRPTELAVAFVSGQARVPEFVVHYNDRVLRRSATTVRFTDTETIAFDYEEVMEPIGG